MKKKYFLWRQVCLWLWIGCGAADTGGYSQDRPNGENGQAAQAQQPKNEDKKQNQPTSGAPAGGVATGAAHAAIKQNDRGRSNGAMKKAKRK